MTLNNIWVFAQATNGAVNTATLELITKARSLASSVSVFVSGDGAAIAAAVGDFGATKVYGADCGAHLPGVAMAAAMKSVIDGGDSPDLIMFPQSYEGRDAMARLSVKLNKTQAVVSLSRHQSLAETLWWRQRLPAVVHSWQRFVLRVLPQKQVADPLLQ